MVDKQLGEKTALVLVDKRGFLHGGDGEILNSGFAPRLYLSRFLHAKPEKRSRGDLFESSNPQFSTKKEAPPDGGASFLAEMERFELSRCY